ncbi:hypothetical protein [Mucilaginibacter sp. FT3.2]|uniref:hypothetical protein n=1 Tax=Mucilaginibacter sp. FT3.2 TaxID=2723090 RepID=UPI00160D910F|nr:hypothetical protein [Mucilaginibacter sp. FT3.2]MBB6231450.1 hypothetical protein [Mucilaginibacter sp. FT3.2]
MRLKFLVAVLATVFITGCKKDNGTTTAKIEVNVQSTTSTNLGGLTIQLLSDEKRITGYNVAQAQSNGVGKVDFDVTVGKTYYLYHYNSDGKILTDANATFIVTGQFTSQFQINSSPGQTPAAKIGDDIHQDINGDGIIDKNDMVIKVMATNAGSTTSVNFVVN